MKLVKTLLATTLTFTAFSTFAATDTAATEAEKVVVSTQEQPAATEDTQAAGQPTAQPATESAAEAPATSAPQAGQ